MKLLLTNVLLTISLGVLHGQITITSGDLPQIGETYLISTDTLSPVNLGTPGSGFQSWNFSTLSESYPSFPTYNATSLTPHATAFSNSNLYTYGPAALFSSLYGGAPVDSQGMNNGYMFWKTDVTGFWIVGFRADSGAYANENVFENPMELLIGTPATYGSTFNNTGRWELPFNYNPVDVDTFYVNRVTKTLSGDAWGSLTLPAATYPAVLRIHEYIIKTDSAYAKMGATPVYSLELTRDTLNNYIYMANSIHYPVCIVHADKNNVIKSVEYYNSTIQSVSESLPETNAKVFPNPASTLFKIEIPKEFLNSNTKLSIFDVMGKQFFNCEMQTCQLILNGENYAEGMYFYSIQNSIGEKLNGRIVIIK